MRINGSPGPLMRQLPERHRDQQRIEHRFKVVCKSNNIEPPDAVAIFNALHPEGMGGEVPEHIKMGRAEEVLSRLDRIGWTPPKYSAEFI